ncbi:MAG: hypothetical protein H0U65_04540 [Rubrobacter sp.]|nr:hypothetical protein [Rubrobacter sp.]
MHESEEQRARLEVCEFAERFLADYKRGGRDAPEEAVELARVIVHHAPRISGPAFDEEVRWLCRDLAGERGLGREGDPEKWRRLRAVNGAADRAVDNAAARLLEFVEG